MAYMYFAKVNVNNDIFKVYKGEEDIDKVLNKLILNIDNKEKIMLSKNKGHIKFISLTTDIEKRFISGRLIRIFEDDIQMYNLDKDDVEELPQDKLARTSTFFFDVQHELIGFTTGKYFGPKQFCDYFEQLINKYTGEGTFNVTLQKDEESFDERVKRFSKISVIRFKIVPKNPCKDEFNNWYANPESIESVEANQVDITYSANNKNEQGLNFNNNYIKNILKGLGIGYISAFVSGLMPGGIKATVVSDKDAPRRFSIPDKDKTSIPSVHEHAQAFIPQILIKLIGKNNE